MERLSRVMGLRVLGIKEGVECGQISEFVVDQESKMIKFVVLDSGKGCFGLQVLPIEAVSGMGQDFTTTATAETVTNVWETEEAMKLAFSDADIINARVVSSTGDVLGKIVDFEFAPESGEIETYVMEDGTEIGKRSIFTLSRGTVFVDKTIMDEPDEPVYEAPAMEAAPAAPAAEYVAPEATEEPVADTAVAAEPEAGEESEEVARSYFNKRRTEFLTGKTVKQDILDNDGNVLVAKDTIVDDAVLEAVTEADKMVELTMSVN